MKIRTKLLGTIVVIICVIGIAAGVFAIFNTVQQKIQSEKLIVLQLKDQLYKEASYINGLFFTAVNSSIEKYKEITLTTAGSFDAVDTISYLKQNSSISQSLEQIKQMDSFMTTRRDRLFSSASSFVETGTKLGLNSFSMALCDFLPLQYYSGKPGFIPYLEAAAAYTGSIRIMSQSCSSSIALLEEQIVHIEKESAAMTVNALLVSLFIAVILITASFIFSLLALNSISRRLAKLSHATSLFSSGDLGTRIELKGNDEITELGSLMETMRVNLSSSMMKIQSTSALALQSKEELERSVSQSEKETLLLSKQISGITSSASDLYTSAQNSNSAVEEISKSIATVSGMIESQSSMVEQSAASITQMAASISSLSAIMEKNKSGSENLVKTASLGENQITNTAQSIELIQKSADTIRNMAEMIEGISEQTNILAMNAAIEAAHAGETGKGFSVVADEIRSLAEASSANSKSISSSLKEILENIAKANEEGKKTADSFLEIQRGIGIVSSSFDEIVNGLLELKEGGNQIMEAMNELSSYTADVNTNSSSIKKQTDFVRDSVTLVNTISNTFINSSREAAQEVERINRVLSVVSEHASTIEFISTQLHDEAEQYKVNQEV